MKTPILGGYAVARSVNAADNRLMNLYPEATPEGGKSSGFLTRCPGYKYLMDVGSGPIRGLWQFASTMYVVSGIELYKVDTGFTATLIGSVSGAGPVSMSDNGEQLFIACNPRSYTYNFNTGAFAEITDEDFPGAVTVGFINGYFVFNEPNSQKVWITEYQNGASIDPLEFSYTDANPDLLISLMVNRNEIWMFGTTSTEVWYYSGDIDFPLARIQGAFNEIGCAAPYSPAKLDNTVFWLGSDPRGNAMVYKASGYGAQRVSTHGIEKVLQSYEYVGDAIGYSYQQEGHTFYVLTFPSANATWCFDVATNEWHERGSWKQGHYNRHRSNCQVNFNNKIILGDFQYGKLYEFDLEYYKDDVGTQRWVRSWRALPPNSNNLNRTAHHSLQVEMETGTKTILAATSAPIPPSPSTTLSYSAKWSENHTNPEVEITNSGHDISVLSSPASTSWLTARSIKTWLSGNYYFEITYTVKEAGEPFWIGAGEANYDWNQQVGLQIQRNAVGYLADSAGSVNNAVYNAGIQVDDLSAYGDANQGDVIMVAVECGDTAAWKTGGLMGGRVWFGRNGVWFNGDPATVTGGQSLFTGNGQPLTPYTAMVGAYSSISGTSTTQKLTANFGDSAFAYTIPDGFKAWNKQSPSTYNNLNTGYIAIGNGAVISVSGSTVTNPNGLLLTADFAVTNFSNTVGKTYFEVSGTLDVSSPGNPAGTNYPILSICEAGLDLLYNPGGFYPPPQTTYLYEGCGFVFLSTTPSVTAPITSIYWGQKWDSGTQSYVSNASAVLTGITECQPDNPNERVMVAIDFDAGKLWFGTKGTFSGDPVAGTDPAWTFTPNNELYVYMGLYAPSSIQNPTITGYFSPSGLLHPIPTGYNVFNSSGFSASSSERIPKVLLRWSDDGGHTWSNYHDKDLGALGEYWHRVIWRRLGMTNKLRDRVYELSGADPVKITITGAELMLSGTNS